MRAPRELVRRVFNRGKNEDATHVVMVYHPTETPPDDWTGFLVHSREELEGELKTPGAFAQIAEVYSLAMDLEDQLQGDNAVRFLD